MKKFVINENCFIELEKCTSQYDELQCPARCSCCESGDICQIKDMQVLGVDFVDGFPEWCPLDNLL